MGDLRETTFRGILGLGGDWIAAVLGSSWVDRRDEVEAVEVGGIAVLVIVAGDFMGLRGLTAHFIGLPTDLLGEEDEGLLSARTHFPWSSIFSRNLNI